jgi:hypothetical protein
MAHFDGRLAIVEHQLPAMGTLLQLLAIAAGILILLKRSARAAP